MPAVKEDLGILTYDGIIFVTYSLLISGAKRSGGPVGRGGRGRGRVNGRGRGRGGAARLEEALDEGLGLGFGDNGADADPLGLFTGDAEEQENQAGLAAMADAAAERQPLQWGSRLKQIVEWLSRGDCDPLIIFDVRRHTSALPAQENYAPKKCCLLLRLG